MGMWKQFENEGKTFFFSMITVNDAGHFYAVHYSLLLIHF